MGLALTAVSGTFILISTGEAVAGNGNGGGGGGNSGGNGGGNSGGNSGGNGGGNSGGNGGGSNAGGNGGNGHGAIARELRNLNAMCANANAFANADPDSNIGRIAAYYTAQEAATDANAGLADATAALDAVGVSYPTLSAAEISALIATETDEAIIATLQLQLTYAEASALQAAGVEAEAQALSAATGDREISEEALAIFQEGCQK